MTLPLAASNPRLLPPPSGRRHGFTITELLTVLTILMVLSLGAVAGYSRFQESRAVNTAAENLQAAMAAARSFAISTNSPYRLVLENRDPVTSATRLSYWVDEIFPDSNNQPFPGSLENARTAKVTRPEFLPPGVQLYDIVTRETTSTAQNAPFAVIRFFRDGSTDGARLRLIDENVPDPDSAKRVVTIRLSAPTGQNSLRTDLK